MSEGEHDDTPEAGKDVEAHGAKQVAGVGLAAAALIGAGAVGVKTALDDDGGRNQGALVDRSLADRLAKADPDKDGYASYRDLALAGFKYDLSALEADVSPLGLFAAGYKVPLKLVGSEDGYAVKEDLIMLKYGPDPALDELAKGSAAEWTKKIREIDLDGDGYATYEELGEVGMKWDPAALSEAAQKHLTAEDLAKAAWKQPVETFGEGGFVVKEDLVLLKMGIDQKLDALIKGEIKD